MSISALLEQEQVLSAKGIAVAVNGAVVPRADWQNHKLQSGNQVLIIKAAQGG